MRDDHSTSTHSVFWLVVNSVYSLTSADLPTRRLVDLPTCRLADLPTSQLADLPTCWLSRLADMPPLSICRVADSPSNNKTRPSRQMRCDVPLPIQPMVTHNFIFCFSCLCRCCRCRLPILSSLSHASALYSGLMKENRWMNLLRVKCSEKK